MKKLMPLLLLLLAVLVLSPSAYADDRENFCLYLFSAGENPGAVQNVLMQYGHMTKAEAAEAVRDLPKVIIPDIAYEYGQGMRGMINNAGGTARLHIKKAYITGFSVPTQGQDSWNFWLNIISSEGAYELESYYWEYKDSRGYWSPIPGRYFEGNSQFRLKITLMAKNDCRFEFSELGRVYINGSPVDFEGIDSMCIVYTDPVYLKDAEAGPFKVRGFHVPMTGETAGENIAALSSDNDRWNIHYDHTHWYDTNGRKLGDNEYFEADTKYYLSIHARPGAGFTMPGRPTGRILALSQADSTASGGYDSCMELKTVQMTSVPGSTNRKLYGFCKDSENPELRGWFGYDLVTGKTVHMWQWPDLDVTSAAYLDGKVYGYAEDGKRFFRFSIDDPEKVYMAKTKNLLPSDMLMYDPRTQTMYSGSRSVHLGMGTGIRTVDLETGELTDVDSLDLALVAWTMDGDGKAVGIQNTTGNICLMNPAAADVKRIVDGKLGANGAQSMCYDSVQNVVYWFRSCLSGGGLYILDPETGDTERQTRFPLLGKGTVTALFAMDGVVPEHETCNPYLCPCTNLEDLPAYEDEAHNAIDRCVVSGWMEPETANSFQPQAPVTRADLAMILWRMQDCPEVFIGEYSDVDINAPYAMAAAWADQSDILRASWGKFHPDEIIDGRDLCDALYRHCKANNKSTTLYFSILKCSDWYKNGPWDWKELNWAVCHDLYTRGEDGTLTMNAGEDVTRASLAVMLSRYAENLFNL